MLKRSGRDKKNTGKNCIKKDFSELDYYSGVVSHPKPNILECEVGWALRSTAVNKLLYATKFPQDYSDP